MAIIANSSIGDAWSDPVTLSGSAEFWQVMAGTAYIATAASSEPASDKDGLLLEPGDIIDLADGEVVRHRSTDSETYIVRRAHA